MKTMEKKADELLDMMLPEFQTWKHQETKELLKKLYLRLFFYDVPESEAAQWVVDLYNTFQKEFSDE